MPQVIKRRRTKGWLMPEGAVFVGRPTKWGNPWVVAKDIPQTRQSAFDNFKQSIDHPHRSRCPPHKPRS